MKKILVLLGVLLCGFAAYTLLQKQSPASLSQLQQLPKLGKIHAFELLNQRGAPFNSQELNNKVWIATFIFTRCQGPCPMMSQKMASLQKKLKPYNTIRHVSITMDPEYDTPEVLKAYGEKYQADPHRWFFLTGDKESIIRIATEAFKLPAGENPDIHSTRFVLVDGQGYIRGYYDSGTLADMDNLKKHAQALASTPSV